ncbi:MAG: hypothetical protein RL113_1406 [Pseudomonadota bacterium]
MVWIYDGSFEGFLTALHRTYTSKTIPDKLTKEISTISLLDECITIETDLEIASRVSKRIGKHFPKKIQERMAHVFLCDDLSFEVDLLLYIRIGFKNLNLMQNLSHPVIYAIEGYQKRLLSTVHKMDAFTRFEMLEDGTLYAKIAPPRNVLPLLGRHFVKRLKKERFIIHDIKRSLIAVSDGKILELYPILEASEPKVHSEELHFQKLWKNFFDNVAIESKQNYTLQRSYIPLLYRGLMTEFKGEPTK